MGQTPDDLEHQIEDLRSETTAIIDTIQGRVRETTDLRAQIERRPWLPYAVGGFMASLLGLTGYAVFRAISHRRSEQRGLRGFWRRLTERLEAGRSSFSTR